MLNELKIVTILSDNQKMLFNDVLNCVAKVDLKMKHFHEKIIKKFIY